MLEQYILWGFYFKYLSPHTPPSEYSPLRITILQNMSPRFVEHFRILVFSNGSNSEDVCIFPTTVRLLTPENH